MRGDWQVSVLAWPEIDCERLSRELVERWPRDDLLGLDDSARIDEFRRFAWSPQSHRPPARRDSYKGSRGSYVSS